MRVCRASVGAASASSGRSAPPLAAPAPAAAAALSRQPAPNPPASLQPRLRAGAISSAAAVDAAGSPAPAGRSSRPAAGGFWGESRAKWAVQQLPGRCSSSLAPTKLAHVTRILGVGVGAGASGCSRQGCEFSRTCTGSPGAARSPQTSPHTPPTIRHSAITTAYTWWVRADMHTVLGHKAGCMPLLQAACHATPAVGPGMAPWPQDRGANFRSSCAISTCWPRATGRGSA